MYCEFYGFREKPFTITPNPRFIFLSKNHREAFAHLLYGIDNHAGFIKLTGEVGTGKTTVLRTLFEQLDERGHRTALIFNPCLTARELMRSINREFGIPCDDLDISQLLDLLNRFLLRENAAGRTVVLVIDEAQNLEPQVLEQIRLISNMETKTDKLIQIVLAGQPELGELLRRSELRQLAQRITVSYHLTPMDFDDSRAYIEHRLEMAGDLRAATFTPQALKQAYRFSGGVPRLINIICDRALLFGYIAESREITGRMVKNAIAEIGKESPSRSVPGRRSAIAGLAVLCLLAAATAGRIAMPGNERAHPSASPSALATALGSVPERESALAACNALMKRWDADPIPPPPSLTSIKDLEGEMAKRGLKLARFTGSLGLLARLDYPAVLEFILPGIPGKRYLALIGADRGKFVIAPSLAGRDSLTGAELESVWSGAAWLPWKNFRDIPTGGTRGSDAAGIQRLLADAGIYTGTVTGSFDTGTVSAIKAFQASRGLPSDGKVGAQTLLQLYRSGKAFPGPRLDVGPDGKRPATPVTGEGTNRK